ncbi:MAG TPA: N-acetyltransferase [Chloroflexi bacterium]|nr:N-acetyltransferase [Chloroflexota bacterium]
MTGKLAIIPAESAAERDKLIKFQWQVYKGDPYWVPPLMSERRTLLDPERHPFHEHAKVRYFTAQRDGRIVGTIAGIINHRHNEYWNDHTGFFGLFEVLPGEEEAAHALLRTAEAFCRDEGMDAIRGPMNFSQNEECGLLVDGWNGPPVILMSYNPRYYVDMIESAGYSKAQDLLAYLTDLRQIQPDGTGINPKLLRVADHVRRRGDITIRTLDMGHFQRDAALFKEIYNKAWSKNWGFVPLTEGELENEIMELKPIVDPEITFFVYKGDQPVAAGLPLPDLNQALHRAYPRPDVPEWWTMAKLFYYWKVRKVITTVRAFAGGVIEDYRGQGLHALMIVEGLKRCVKRYQQLEVSWVLESNIPMRQTAAHMGAKLYRTYRIYQKPL